MILHNSASFLNYIFVKCWTTAWRYHEIYCICDVRNAHASVSVAGDAVWPQHQPIRCLKLFMLAWEAQLILLKFTEICRHVAVSFKIDLYSNW